MTEQVADVSQRRTQVIQGISDKFRSLMTAPTVYGDVVDLQRVCAGVLEGVVSTNIHFTRALLDFANPGAFILLQQRFATDCLIPPSLAVDLLQVGIIGQRAETFWGELVPCGAACVHDGVIVCEQPVGEMALP